MTIDNLQITKYIDKINENGEFFITLTDFEQSQLYNFDAPELTLNLTIGFTLSPYLINITPFYINDRRYVFYKEYRGDANHSHMTLMQNFVNQINEDTQQEGYNFKLLNQSAYDNRVHLRADKQFTFRVDNYYLAKTLGVQPGYTYQSYGQKTQYMDFPKQTFLQFLKQIYIECDEVEDNNFIINNKKRKLILKNTFDSYPGDRVIIQSQFDADIQLYKLCKGLMFRLTDENFQGFNLFNNFTVIIQLYTSKKFLKRRETQIQKDLELQQQLKDEEEQQKQIEKEEQERIQNMQQLYNQIIQDINQINGNQNYQFQSQQTDQQVIQNILPNNDEEEDLFNQVKLLNLQNQQIQTSLYQEQQVIKNFDKDRDLLKNQEVYQEVKQLIEDKKQSLNKNNNSINQILSYIRNKKNNRKPSYDLNQYLDALQTDQSQKLFKTIQIPQQQNQYQNVQIQKIQRQQDNQPEQQQQDQQDQDQQPEEEQEEEQELTEVQDQFNKMFVEDEQQITQQLDKDYQQNEQYKEQLQKNKDKISQDKYNELMDQLQYNQNANRHVKSIFNQINPQLPQYGEQQLDKDFMQKIMYNVNKYMFKDQPTLIQQLQELEAIQSGNYEEEEQEEEEDNQEEEHQEEEQQEQDQNQQNDEQQQDQQKEQQQEQQQQEQDQKEQQDQQENKNKNETSTDQQNLEKEQEKQQLLNKIKQNINEIKEFLVHNDNNIDQTFYLYTSGKSPDDEQEQLLNIRNTYEELKQKFPDQDLSKYKNYYDLYYLIKLQRLQSISQNIGNKILNTKQQQQAKNQLQEFQKFIKDNVAQEVQILNKDGQLIQSVNGPIYMLKNQLIYFDNNGNIHFYKLHKPGRFSRDKTPYYEFQTYITQSGKKSQTSKQRVPETLIHMKDSGHIIKDKNKFIKYDQFIK